MAGFDLEFLNGMGVTGEQAQAVLAAHEEAVRAALADTVPKEEAQRMADEALAEAAKGVDAEAVARLEAERDMLRAIGGEDFEEVKPKFREQVYALLERGPGARPVAEQMAAIREKYEEYFIDGGAPARLPRFGGPTRGSMPRGALGAAEQLCQSWGFSARRNG